MRYRNMFILFITILMLTICYAPLLHAASKAQFSIVYTNDVMGEVEPCG